MCACRRVAGASPGSSVKGRGCPVARCVEAGTFSALPRAPLCERYYNVTRATACFVARFCRPWGWGGVVRRGGAVFPASGVVGQPTRGGAAGGLRGPSASLLCPGSVARTPEALLSRRQASRLDPKRCSPWHRVPLGVASWTNRCPLHARTTRRIISYADRCVRWLHSIRALRKRSKSLCLQHTTAASSAQTTR